MNWCDEDAIGTRPPTSDERVGDNGEWPDGWAHVLIGAHDRWNGRAINYRHTAWCRHGLDRPRIPHTCHDVPCSDRWQPTTMTMPHVLRRMWRERETLYGVRWSDSEVYLTRESVAEVLGFWPNGQRYHSASDKERTEETGVVT